MDGHTTAHGLRPDIEQLVAPFRPGLIGLAFRLLGSFADTDRALARTQELLAEVGPPGAEVGDWLTLTTAQVSLEILRLRAAGAPAFPWALPDFVVTTEPAHDARQAALLGGATGTALFATLHGLEPMTRVAHVLHDLHGVPYEVLGAQVLDVSAAGAEELAARGRASTRDVAVPDADVERQHTAVRTFYRVARRAEHGPIIELLHPRFRVQNDSGDHVLSGVFEGADEVVQRAVLITRADLRLQPALINGAAGVVVSNGTAVVALASFTVVDGLLVRVDTLSDSTRVPLYDIPGLVL
jgi:DNA-directed RNA polymerase specialized sigma24 family protein